MFLFQGCVLGTPPFALKEIFKIIHHSSLFVWVLSESWRHLCAMLLEPNSWEKIGRSLPWAARKWLKYENKLGDRMIKQLLNSLIAKYRDLSVSRRSIICLSLRLRQIIDLFVCDNLYLSLILQTWFFTCWYFAPANDLDWERGVETTSSISSLASLWKIRHSCLGQRPSLFLELFFE